MYNLGGGHGGPLVSANLEGRQSIYMQMYIFWWRAEAETKARRRPSPKLYIYLLLGTREGTKSGVGRRERMKQDSGIKDRYEKSIRAE